MTKEEKYQTLIQKRKNFSFSGIGLKNYSDFTAEDNYVDAYEQWHSHLDADIMLIAQDFADWETFEKDNGKIEPIENHYKYPTNKNLTDLFKILNIDIGHPLTPNKTAKLFFTNAVVGLKGNGMQGKIENRWIETGTNEFLSPLIDLVQPKIIIALGRIPFDAICSIYPNQVNPATSKSKSLKKIIENSPYIIPNGTRLFPVYHCGGQSARNRKIEEQKTDWQKINSALN
ncbi:MAG: uracil-DNA glycosylase family protein [Bacteroidia bacterium]